MIIVPILYTLAYGARIPAALLLARPAKNLSHSDNCFKYKPNTTFFFVLSFYLPFFFRD
ncbi:hypothetical protein L9F63_003836, partial [Diploptera punctata]